MEDIREDVRFAHRRKAEYTDFLTKCEHKIVALKKTLNINKFELEIENVSESEGENSVQMTDLSVSVEDSTPSSLRDVIPKHFLEVEPVSDAEEVLECQPIVEVILDAKTSLDDVSDRQPSVSEVPVTGNTCIPGRAQLTDAKEVDLCQFTGNAGGLDPAASALSSISYNCSQSSPCIRSTKVDNMLDEVMCSSHSVDQLLALPSVSDSAALLPTEDNVLPLLNSVMSSLTEHSFRKAISSVQTSPSLTSSYTEGCTQWNATDNTLDSCFHSCNDSLFTQSSNTSPMLLLPMVVKGGFNLGIETSSVSAVAMGVVEQSIVNPVGNCSSVRPLVRRGNNCALKVESGELQDIRSGLNTGENFGDSVGTLDHSLSSPSLPTSVVPNKSETTTLLPIPGVKQTATSQLSAARSPTLKSKSVPHILTKAKHTSPLLLNEEKISFESPKDNIPSKTKSMSQKKSSAKGGSIGKATVGTPVSLGGHNDCLSEVDSIPTKGKSKPFINDRSKPAGSQVKERGNPKSASSTTEPRHVILQEATEVGDAVDAGDVEPQFVAAAANDSEKEKLQVCTEVSSILAGITKVKEEFLDSVAESMPKPDIAVSDRKPLKPENMKVIVPNYVKQMEDSKNQVDIVRRSAPQELDPTEISSQTASLRTNLPMTQGESSGIDVVDELSCRAKTFIKKIVESNNCASLMNRAAASSCALLGGAVGSLCAPVDAGESLSTTPLGGTGAFSWTPVCAGVSQSFSLCDLVSANCVIKNLSLYPTPGLFTKRVLKHLEDPSPASTMGSTASTPVSRGYQAYRSPLLIFGSYRLSSGFSSSAKAPLDSTTYSSKLDPDHVICRFELTGTCSDASCTDQHIRDLAMTNEELVQDLLSYCCPSLAGSTEDSLADSSSSQARDAAGSVSEKLSALSNNLLKRCKDKLSAEELYKLVVYETNKERAKTQSRQEIVSFKERPRHVRLGTSGKASSSGRDVVEGSTPLQRSLLVDQRR